MRWYKICQDVLLKGFTEETQLILAMWMGMAWD
jgi:hypothetical protein